MSKPSRDYSGPVDADRPILVPTAFHLTPDMLNDARLYAWEHRVSVSWVFREALYRFLQTEAPADQ